MKRAGSLFLVAALVGNSAVDVEGFVVSSSRAGGMLGRPRQKSVRTPLLAEETADSTTASRAEGDFFQRFDDSGKPITLTKEDKEEIFINALESFYFENKQTLSDEDFDNLKQDLMWEGSDLVMLNRDETKFLSAVQAYAKGESLLSDKEFDDLKQTLRMQGSRIATSNQAKCVIDTGVCRITWTKDQVRNKVIYVPWFAPLLLGFLIVTELIPGVRDISPAILLGIGAPLSWKAAEKATNNFFLTDPLILSGPCPNCNQPSHIYFGDVLGVEGFKDTAQMTCKNCKHTLTVQRDTYRVESKPPEEAPKK